MIGPEEAEYEDYFEEVYGQVQAHSDALLGSWRADGTVDMAAWTPALDHLAAEGSVVAVLVSWARMLGGAYTEAEVTAQLDALVRQAIDEQHQVAVLRHACMLVEASLRGWTWAEEQALMDLGRRAFRDRIVGELVMVLATATAPVADSVGGYGRFADVRAAVAEALEAAVGDRAVETLLAPLTSVSLALAAVSVGNADEAVDYISQWPVDAQLQMLMPLMDVLFRGGRRRLAVLDENGALAGVYTGRDPVAGLVSDLLDAVERGDTVAGAAASQAIVTADDATRLQVAWHITASCGIRLGQLAASAEAGRR
ncbi:MULTISPECIES: hypothetical protein [unclassified Crossiella]|uniref:hypothetical protein n=1 Tax=unclassified Crossiella TaxID=2620835 RepID=UPI001FFE947A|nr:MULTISPECIES: hypothetical protein [unclassified Crossiella]MCK2240098.1 hypothetical protein [Crossiella sp. S99.2]MCK2252807.1 hypothetical protein [Crossiella sp. S99.1]